MACLDQVLQWRTQWRLMLRLFKPWSEFIDGELMVESTIQQELQVDMDGGETGMRRFRQL